MIELIDDGAVRLEEDGDFQTELRTTLARAWREADRNRGRRWGRHVVVFSCVLLVGLAAFGVARLRPAADRPATVTPGSSTEASEAAAGPGATSPSTMGAPSSTAMAAPAPVHPLVAALVQLEQYAPSDLPYDRALAEALGVPPHVVNAAVQALHIDGARECLSAYGRSVDALRWFPGTTPAPTGHGESAIRQLEMLQSTQGSTEPDLAEAARECWDRFKVTNPLPFFDRQLPAVTADAADVAAAQAQFRDCLAQLGRTPHEVADADRQFFEQARDITAAVRAGTLSFDEGIARLEDIKAAEESDAALLEPCRERLDETVRQSIARAQQAVLDDLDGPLEIPDEVVSILADLQPYVAYEP